VKKKLANARPIISSHYSFVVQQPNSEALTGG
jgi:hypothetical protein